MRLRRRLLPPHPPRTSTSDDVARLLHRRHTRFSKADAASSPLPTSSMGIMPRHSTKYSGKARQPMTFFCGVPAATLLRRMSMLNRSRAAPFRISQCRSDALLRGCQFSASRETRHSMQRRVDLLTLLSAPTVKVRWSRRKCGVWGSRCDRIGLVYAGGEGDHSSPITGAVRRCRS